MNYNRVAAGYRKRRASALKTRLTRLASITEPADSQRSKKLPNLFALKGQPKKANFTGILQREPSPITKAPSRADARYVSRQSTQTRGK